MTRTRSTGLRDWPAAEAELERWLRLRSLPVPAGPADGSTLARDVDLRAAGLLPPDAAAVRGLLVEYLLDRRPFVAAWARILHGCKALARHLGPLALEAVTPRQARAYVAARRGEGAGDGTIGRELAYLSAALRLAVAEGWLARLPPIDKPPRPAPRERWLTREEAARLVEACAEPHVRLFVVLGLHTCGRGGAVRALTWGRVDFAGGLIDLREPGKGRGAKRAAVVPMNATSRAALLEAREVASGEWVVERRGRRVGSVRAGFAAACRRAGLEGVTPHTLRHTGATWLAQAGVSMDVIARFLGHSSPAVTARVYAKFSPEWLRAAAAALEG